MNDAYEMYDYGDLFPIVSSSSIRMKEESKNNTNEKYLKELKRRADEATRQVFTDKLSDRIKELNEVLNTRALEEMVLFIDNRPIKLKGTNFANMKETSGTMNAGLDNGIGTNKQGFDIQSVNPYGLKSDVSDAFASYGTQDSSFSEPEPLPAVIPDDMSKGSSFLNPAGDLVTNDEVVSGTESEPISTVSPDDMSKGSSYLNPAGDLPVGEVVSGTESEPISTVSPDDMSKGSSYLNPSEDLPVNDEVVSGTESESLPANDEVVSAINDYVNRYIGSREDTSTSDMSSDVDPIQIETPKFESSDYKDISEELYLSDGQLKEQIAGYIGAQRTEDGNYTFPAATIPDENSKDVIRGEDVQVVPEREDTSVSAEISYADNNVDSQKDERFAEETFGDVSDSLTAVSSTDNIFGDAQNEEPFGFDSSDMSSTVEGENESESIDSSPAVDPDLGELIGYSKPEGGIDYFSLVPDVMRQFEEAKQNVARLNAEKAKKELMEAESANNVHTLESEVEDKVRRLFRNTADFERQGSELAGQIDSITQNIANNEHVASMLSGVSSQLDAMLVESTDDKENSDVKGRSM